MGPFVFAQSVEVMHVTQTLLGRFIAPVAGVRSHLFQLWRQLKHIRLLFPLGIPVEPLFLEVARAHSEGPKAFIGQSGRFLPYNGFVIDDVFVDQQQIGENLLVALEPRVLQRFSGCGSAPGLRTQHLKQQFPPGNRHTTQVFVDVVQTTHHVQTQ